MKDQPIGGSGWRLAQSLQVLLAECNQLAPARDKSYDGTIGDANHATRASRHNPNRAGVVCALDITSDPAHGMPIHDIADQVRRSPHPNLEYIISNKRIASRLKGWEWRAYTGSSPHTAHAHFAVGRGPDSEPIQPYDNTTAWGVAPKEEDDMNDDDRKLLIETRERAGWAMVRALGNNFSIAIVKAELQGDAAKATVLKAEKAQAIASERERLHLGDNPIGMGPDV